ncbi:hypothetical protein LXL04_025397 [Taraxacum kok-saghyz]
MEVEDVNASNHLQESTTAVSNESLSENKSMNDIELKVEVPESNTQEEQGEKSSVLSPKLDDPNHFDPGAEGGTAEEKEVIVECRNSEQTGGCWNSLVVEPTSLLKDEKDRAEDVISTSDVAATERGGSELPNSIKADVGECSAAVSVPDNGLDVVEETVNNREEETNTNVSFVNEDDKDGGAAVPLLPVAEIDEIEEVKEDVKSDGVEFVAGAELITEGEADVQVLAAEVVADEEEKAAGVTENDDEEPTVADEEKSVDTDLDTDEEATMADADEEKAPTEEIETELPDSAPKGGRGKRKRGGKNPKATPKSTPGLKKRIEEEDVCFICFDGGDLVLCDLRTCPKAYHPSCVNRDAAFFQTKGRWNCGWHVCSTCQKKAEYMCYTCTFSLCKSCVKTNVILCVKDKEKKGFCETCMKTIMLIEKKSEENQPNVDFDDKNSWEYLFKDYWTDTKSKLNLSLPDLLEAKNAWKGSGSASASDPAGTPAVHSEGGSGSENPTPTLQPKKKRIRKPKKQKSENIEWASQELLEFVTHMTAGDTSFKSQFDVQALLLEYIKTNKLRDSRRKSYIICDGRLERLFGKPRVGHFEMLKLLESHFLVKEDSQMEAVVVQVDDDEDDDEGNESVKSGKEKKRKVKKKVDREVQSNREDYAAIDTHNISLIYMRRKLVEDLVKDNETFDKKVVGTFVRIRIPGANKNDIHRLVQVTGTTKLDEEQKSDIMLEVLNLDKTECVSIDSISNQDFTEDECKRLRQSIKCGLIKTLKVGDILDKATELQAARVDDGLESEVLRLSHLRDRASDLGQKLQVLKTPEERARRLQDIPRIHDDPTMDPYHVSDDESQEDDNKQDTYKSKISSRFNKRQDYPSKEPWTSRSPPAKNYEYTRTSTFSNKPENLRDPIVQQPIVVKKTEDSQPPTTEITETTPCEVNETDKTWHYKDPSGKIQGPFTMSQLRKWNNSKFFPVDLRIWRKGEKEDDGILLTDALEGRFTKHDERDTFGNLPSPTPNQNVVGLYDGGSERMQSPTPSGGPRVAVFGGGGNMPPQIVQPVVEQSGVYGWSGGVVNNQWGGVPNVVQNHAGNFLPSPAPVNLPPPPPVQQANISWGAPGNQNMNWGRNVECPQLTGTVNVNSPPWGVGGWVNPNQGWVPGPSGNPNPNWVGPSNTGTGWTEMGWGPPRHRGMWSGGRGGYGFHGSDTRH